MDIPLKIAKILNTLTEHGFEAYVVGGCVRDSILGRQPNDWDISTSALPKEVKSIFPHTYDTGIKHGTVTVVIDGENIEITTFRIESVYEDYRRPKEVVFTNKLIEDLRRRDFTINSIAYNCECDFIDPFGGINDIKLKLLKGVGEPSERFKEDALRMLRALRFCAQLDFEIDSKTYEAIIKNAELIKHISQERIRDELVKILTSQNPAKIVALSDCGLLDFTIPEMSALIHDEDMLKQIKEVNNEFYTRAAVFFKKTTDDNLNNILKRLKLDNNSIKTIKELHKYQQFKLKPDPYYIRKIIADIGIDQFKRLLNLYATKTNNITSIEECLNNIISNNHCLSLKDLAISGNTLIELGFTKGKEIGEILNYLLDCVLKDPTQNTKEQLIRHCKK